MIFSATNHLNLPCHFASFTPGEVHNDGRRYLPTIGLSLAEGTQQAYHLPVVDRHHQVNEAHVGLQGNALLVMLLCQFRLQTSTPRQGLLATADGIPGAPRVYGHVTHVATWEIPETPLPYQSLYCEFVIDIGMGTVGVRTHATAPQLRQRLGTDTLNVGDWVEIWRPRIDILAFQPK
ncbi:MAG: hypothetical protein ACO3F2_09265 [Roseiflexaceae bacterium]